MDKRVSSNFALEAKGIKISCEDGAIRLYRKDRAVTFKTGFHLAMNTAGIWTDSSYGIQELLVKGQDFVVIKNTWKTLPITCFWKFKIEEGGVILWNVDMEIEEFLEIDERRATVLLPPSYKSWVNSYEEGRFPQIIGWQDMPLENFSSRLVGLRFSKDGLSSPLALEFEDNKFGKMYPSVQNTSVEIGGHLIGVRFQDSQDKKRFRPGKYNYCSARILIFDNEKDLDDMIEKKRNLLLDSARRKSKASGNKKIKILLANMPWCKGDKHGVRAGSRWPHIKDISEGDYLPFPFFLAYAASLLKKNNINATLVDFIANGVSEDEFLNDLSKRDFDILVTETSVPSFYYDLKLLRRISSLDIPIILCGPHPEIYNPDFLEKNNFIDFVMFGEYETTLLESVKHIIKGETDFSSIKGLIWRDKKNNVIKNTSREPFDIKILPWPHRDALPMDRYWDLPGDIPHPSAQIVASRGCPFSCNFCLWPQLLFGGKTYRTRDTKDVVDEMEFLIREKGFKSIYFDDDTFNIGKKRMLDLCGEIIKRGLNSTPWAIMARADQMDKEMLDAMKKAGLHAVKYGVESISQESVNRCGKCLDIVKTREMIKYTKELGIKIHLTFSFGLPGETKETIKESIEYALKTGPQSVQFSIITPFPGTSLFDQLDKEKRILTKDWSLYDGHFSCVFQPDNLSPAELEEAKRYAYRAWAEHERKRRGFLGDLRRFIDYRKKYSMEVALKKLMNYVAYILFKRKKFVGRI